MTKSKTKPSNLFLPSKSPDSHFTIPKELVTITHPSAKPVSTACPNHTTIHTRQSTAKQQLTPTRFIPRFSMPTIRVYFAHNCLDLFK